MSSDQTQPGPSMPIPSIPAGTPGRDSRAELPTPLPPGPQQPWRKLGPGNRTPITVITIFAAATLAIIAIVVVAVGSVMSFLNSRNNTGVLVLEQGQYQLTERGCRGAGPAQGIQSGVTIEFGSGELLRGSSLDGGELRAGTCRFTFSVAELSRAPRYEVRVAGLEATPFEGSDIYSDSGVVVYLATS